MPGVVTVSVKFTELQCKEVICVSTGQRLGFVGDVQVELPDGNVRALVVPCPPKMMGLGPKREEYIIPWKCIQRIGPDIVLVDTEPEKCRCRRPGPGADR